MTVRQTDTGRQRRLHLRIASRSKNRSRLQFEMSVVLSQIDPEKSLSLLDQPMEIRKKCEAEAEAMVKKTNALQVHSV